MSVACGGGTNGYLLALVAESRDSPGHSLSAGSLQEPAFVSDVSAETRLTDRMHWLAAPKPNWVRLSVSDHFAACHQNRGLDKN